MPDLTTRQREVYSFVQAFIEKNGYAPSIREVGGHFGIRSANGVVCHLKALEGKGFIRRGSGRARGLAVVPEEPQATTVRRVGPQVVVAIAGQRFFLGRKEANQLGWALVAEAREE